MHRLGIDENGTDMQLMCEWRWIDENEWINDVVNVFECEFICFVFALWALSGA